MEHLFHLKSYNRCNLFNNFKKSSKTRNRIFLINRNFILTFNSSEYTHTHVRDDRISVGRYRTQTVISCFIINRHVDNHQSRQACTPHSPFLFAFCIYLHAPLYACFSPRCTNNVAWLVQTHSKTRTNLIGSHSYLNSRNFDIARAQNWSNCSLFVNNIVQRPYFISNRRR